MDLELHNSTTKEVSCQAKPQDKAIYPNQAGRTLLVEILRVTKRRRWEKES